MRKGGDEQNLTSLTLWREVVLPNLVKARAKGPRLVLLEQILTRTNFASGVILLHISKLKIFA